MRAAKKEIAKVAGVVKVGKKGYRNDEAEYEEGERDGVCE